MSGPKKYKIESCIPIPPKRSRSPREGTSELIETILAMGVGDSFCYGTYESATCKEIASDRRDIGVRARYAGMRRDLEIRVVTRTIIAKGGGVELRVWKIKHEANV